MTIKVITDRTVKAKIHFLTVLLLSLFMTACVSVPEEQDTSLSRTTIVASGELNLLHTSAIPTFALHPRLANVVPNEKINSYDVEILMRETIIKVMEQKGYQLVTLNDSPDMLVGYGFALGSSVSDQQILSKTGLVAGLSTHGVDMSEYEKGSVLIELYHPQQVDSVWRVLAQGFTNFEHEGEKRAERFEMLVNSMLGSVVSPNTQQ